MASFLGWLCKQQIKKDLTKDQDLPKLLKTEKGGSNPGLTLHRPHIYNTHLLKGEDPPFCVGCDEPLTVEHILLKCIDFYEICLKYYQVINLEDLFELVDPNNIFEFLKEVGLYQRI